MHTKTREAVPAILSMRENGATHDEIAKAVGIGRGTVLKVLHENGMFGTTEHGKEKSRQGADKGRLAAIRARQEGTGGGFLKPKHTENEIRMMIAEWDDRFEYVSGYVNCDKPVLIRCKTCGSETEQSFVSIRKRNRSYGCRCCKEREIELEKRKKTEEALINHIIRQKLKSIEREELLRDHPRECKECGITFYSLKRTSFCSAACSRKSTNRRSSRRKDKRLGKDRKALKTWMDIYKRTKDLTCAACGETCDTSDFIVREDGVVICGDNYPSIDHIVPVSKGGTDEWSNVQIMCRRCNCEKSDKVLPPPNFFQY